MSPSGRLRFANRTVVVTGGASGIGRVVARRFAEEGAKVAIGDIADAEPHLAELPGDSIAVRVDVTNADDVDRLVCETEKLLGPVDVLVNNAGFTAGDDVLEIDEATWDSVLAGNLKSAFLCTKRVLPQMLERGSGVVVNMASVNGLGYFGHEAYSAAKAGLINFTQSLAVRYGPHGVRAVAIAPGTIRTPAWDKKIQQRPEIFERLRRWYPLGRLGEPEDVASAVLFLASDEASWITGTVLRVDGGLTAGPAPMISDLLAEGE